MTQGSDDTIKARCSGQTSSPQWASSVGSSKVIRVMIQPKISLQECLNIPPAGESQCAYGSGLTEAACAGVKLKVKPRNSHPCFIKPPFLFQSIWKEIVFKFWQARYQIVMLVWEHSQTVQSILIWLISPKNYSGLSHLTKLGSICAKQGLNSQAYVLHTCK